MTGGVCDGNDNNPAGTIPKRPSKVRDIFTDRVVGIIGGAFIPLVLLFIPIVNKYLDNTKEIQTLEIQNNSKEIDETKDSVKVLTRALIASQIQLQKTTEQLSKNSIECENKCDAYCANLKNKEVGK